MSGEVSIREVLVTLRGYISASEYSVEWQAEREPLQKVYEPQPEHSYSNTSWLDTFRLEPGDYLFVNWYQSDEDDRQILIQVPFDSTAFRQFAAAAINAAKAKHRDDSWILEYTVYTWVYTAPDYWDEVYGRSQVDYPYSIREAIDKYKSQQ